mgnify:CR=1 FL=1
MIRRVKQYPWAGFYLILETFVLISRFNAVLLGLGNFYYGFIPKSCLNRWIKIIRIRFCLFKTLAEKYNTNINGVFERFRITTETGKTMKYTVKNTFNHGYTIERNGKDINSFNWNWNTK